MEWKPTFVVEKTLPNGRVAKLGDDVLVEDGGMILVAQITKFEDDSDGFPVVRCLIIDTVRHTMDNVGLPSANIKSAKFRHISTPRAGEGVEHSATGLRFCYPDEYASLQKDHAALGEGHERTPSVSGEPPQKTDDPPEETPTRQLTKAERKAQRKQQEGQ